MMEPKENKQVKIKGHLSSQPPLRGIVGIRMNGDKVKGETSGCGNTARTD